MDITTLTIYVNDNEMVAAEYLSETGAYLEADGDVEVSDVTWFAKEAASSEADVVPVAESVRTQFLRVMRTELAKYPWASEPGRLDRTMASVEGTMSGDRRCIINGASWTAAWKAIGQKGKPTYKGLHALFAS